MLPMRTPLQTLQFSLNPATGMQLVADPGGNIETTLRTERESHHTKYVLTAQANTESRGRAFVSGIAHSLGTGECF